ncbi:PREDICTED: GRIP and coiled-coil domain-containing protein 1 [Tinamus guttatus]|uniref:GRIP and coiled-coil domain-containing protein 1 n=1 Tax=Tinamus guttatus TaxID=94827 RepID=UPI00052F38AC|nr:PREDICTED: GRIP and coiled-coil domain-containing protein 1 [Tinamus guttatus]
MSPRKPQQPGRLFQKRRHRQGWGLLRTWRRSGHSRPLRTVSRLAQLRGWSLLSGTLLHRSTPLTTKSPRLRDLHDEMAALKSHFQAQLLQEMRKVTSSLGAESQGATAALLRPGAIADGAGALAALVVTVVRRFQPGFLLASGWPQGQRALGVCGGSLDTPEFHWSPCNEPWRYTNPTWMCKAPKNMPAFKIPFQPVPAQPAPGIEKLCELELPAGAEPGDGEKATASYYQQELKQLKEEFERYKMRAQVVLKNKSAKDGSLAKELEEAQEQLADLREKYIALRLSAEETEKRHQQELEAKKQELSQLQQSHRQDLERCQLDYRERTLRLEEEMHKQRDRALAVLAEKDPDFRYAEQLARKEVEMAALRKQKHGLETELHQLREKVLLEEEKHREEVSALQGKLQKNRRDKSREGANLEYLKNIVYRFLTLPDSLGRQQTLTAILTILHFSPEEKQSIAKQSAFRWLSGKR